MIHLTFHKPIRATKVVHTLLDGSCLRFDSKTEYAYWQWQLGQNQDGKCNRFFPIEGGTYQPDFLVDRSTREFFVEVKGFESPTWRRTKKQLRERYPKLRLLIVFGRADANRGFVTTKTEWLNPELEGEGK